MALSFDVRVVFIGLAALAFAVQDAPRDRPTDIARLFAAGTSVLPCTLEPPAKSDAELVTGSIPSQAAAAAVPVCR